MIEVQNKKVTDWVAECAAMTKPEEIVWIDGAKHSLRQFALWQVETGEMIKLNEEKLPGCYYYRTDPKDVARDEKRTVICTTEEKDAGPTNNWVQKDEMYAKMRKLFDGSMKGRTMYVIPYSMGVVGSKFSKIGIESTELHLCGSFHEYHDAHRRPCNRRAQQRGELRKMLTFKGTGQRRKQIHRTVPGREHNLEHQLRLRRQCSPRQEMFCTSHRAPFSASARDGWQNTC